MSGSSWDGIQDGEPGMVNAHGSWLGGSGFKGQPGLGDMVEEACGKGRHHLKA